jgi:hypothetical protein
MLSKSALIARNLLVCIVLARCAVSPWQRAEATEVNVAFTLEKNVVLLPTVTMNGRGGRFLFGSAAAQSAIDPRFGSAARYQLGLNERHSIALQPVVVPLGDLVEAIIGADAAGNGAVTLDYHAGLLTFQNEGIYPAYMSLYHFTDEPKIVVEVNGRALAAVVDTTNPDTLVLPGAGSRETARVAIAGTDFGSVDIGRANVSRPRVGNRLLSKFLVTIDYGRGQVGLWRDPRVPL